MDRDDNRPAKVKYRAYFIAAALAIVTTMIVAPEMQEGDAMNPALSDGDALIYQKATYSKNRGMPEVGDLVVINKDIMKDTKEDNPIRRVAGLPGDEVNGIKVKKNQVYVVYDNQSGEKNIKNDTMGIIDTDIIRGKVLLRVWPLSQIGGIEG